MSANATLTVLVACLFAAGFYLVLERSLTRLLLGVLLLGNGANLLLLSAGGPAGGAPIAGVSAPQDMADPLAQAMVLTAIVITMAMAAFLLAVVYRRWQLSRADEVEDDVEDVAVAARGRSGGSGGDDDGDPGDGDPDDPEAAPAAPGAGAAP